MVDLGLVHNPEAAMSAKQVRKVRRLSDPRKNCTGNTLTLAEYLDKHTRLVAEQDGVQHRCASNCHYIIKDDLVLFAYGFHGANVFEAVVNDEEFCLRLIGGGEQGGEALQ
jgi:hypothetical protein